MALRQVSRRRLMILCGTSAMFCTLGMNGCPPGGPPLQLLHLEISHISCADWSARCGNECSIFCSDSCGWVDGPECGNVTEYRYSFQPTAVGRTVTITITTAGSTGIQFYIAATEGFSVLAGDQHTPSELPLQLSFITQTTNVHSLTAYPSATSGVSTGSIGDVVTIDVTQGL